MRCERISWRQFDTLCHRLTDKIIDSGFQPELLIAIGRGGYMPARIVADHLGMMNLTTFKIEHYRGPDKSARARVVYPLSELAPGQRVLLIDDISDSGDTFDVALDHVRQHAAPTQLRTAVLHHKTVSTFTPDFYAARIVKWRWITYPWAVTEDLTSLIPKLEGKPGTVEQIRESLATQNGMRVTRQQVEDALRLLNA